VSHNELFLAVSKADGKKITTPTVFTGNLQLNITVIHPRCQAPTSGIIAS